MLLFFVKGYKSNQGWLGERRIVFEKGKIAVVFQSLLTGGPLKKMTDQMIVNQPALRFQNNALRRDEQSVADALEGCGENRR